MGQPSPVHSILASAVTNSEQLSLSLAPGQKHSMPLNAKVTVYGHLNKSPFFYLEI